MDLEARMGLDWIGLDLGWGLGWIGMEHLSWGVWTE